MHFAPFDIGVVVTAIASIINTVIVVRLGKVQGDHAKKLEKIDDQVSNDHAHSLTPNLRVDLDSKFLALNTRIDALSTETRGIRKDLARVEDRVFLGKGQ